MNKIYLVLGMLFLCAGGIVGQNSTKEWEMQIREQAMDKADMLDSLITLTSEQKVKMIETELIYLTKVKNIESSWWKWSIKRRLKKMEAWREKQYQAILTRDQYLKFSVIENKLLKRDNRTMLSL